MTSGTVISYPIPPYQNLPIQAQYYQPSVFDISAITQGITTTVTTSVNNNYVIGQLIRFLIPPTFGIIQLNQLTGYVTSLPAPNQVVVLIDTRNMNAFIASTAPTPAQIVAIGDINSGATNSNGPLQTITFIPGSFINISPI